MKPKHWSCNLLLLVPTPERLSVDQDRGLVLRKFLLLNEGKMLLMDQGGTYVLGPCVETQT